MNERVYYSYEAEQRARRERLMMVLVVAGLSVSIGTMIALLFAPHSGDETRQHLSEQMSQTVSQSRQAAEAAAHQLIKNADKMKDNVEERLRAVGE